MNIRNILIQSSLTAASVLSLGLSLSGCSSHPSQPPLANGSAPAPASPGSVSDAPVKEIKTAVTAECAGLSDINAEGGQEIHYADFIDGTLGHYKLTSASMALNVQMGGSKEKFAVQLEYNAKAKKASLVCKDLSQLPQGHSFGQMEAPSLISRKDGALGSTETVPYKVFGNEVGQKDKVSSRSSEAPLDKNLAEFGTRIARIGSAKIFKMSESNFEIQSLETVTDSESGTVTNYDIRYKYMLVK